MVCLVVIVVSKKREGKRAIEREIERAKWKSDDVLIGQSSAQFRPDQAQLV